ncbi:MAG: carboxypeptidase regulatory-like domain-containing protein [Bacteroidales bacterium]|nr:carboxypeptidase regulatory-like domain-containing protein [Bacteroidales bacterium]
MIRNRLILFLMLLLSAVTLCAQEDEPDSVVVLGHVVNRLAGEAEPYCMVHFLQGSDTVATAFCDYEGYFSVDLLPVGTYGLSVSLRGMTLYQADLVLGDNAMLSISVITDSFQLRTLREVAIVAPKHQLAEQGQLITHYDDPRLWDFMNRPCWGTESHYGGADAGFKPGQFYAPAKGRDDDRIWQIYWPDCVLPVPKEHQAQEEKKEASGE